MKVTLLGTYPPPYGGISINRRIEGKNLTENILFSDSVKRLYMENRVFFVAVGDIFLGAGGKNNSPFKYVSKLLSNADIVFGNLEVVLSNKGTPAEKRVLLRTNPDDVDYLVNAGFNIVNVANNHLLDYGVEGYRNTLNILKRKGISYIGIPQNSKNSPCIMKKNGLKIGFLGYSQNGDDTLISRIDERQIIEDIIRLKEFVDIVIISLHWGIEYIFYPAPNQQKLARKFVDAGANVIIGHHPHVLQGLELYENAIIAYSLGNFQFGVEQDKDFHGADIGLIIQIELSREGFKGYDVIPVKINEDYQPIEINGREREDCLHFLNQISICLRKQISPRKWFEQTAEIYLKSQIESWKVRIRKYGFIHFRQFCRWLIHPFTMKMLFGLLIQKIKSR